MSQGFIDLYSDTKSQPTDGMRQAIMSAVVGDEQKDEDPTVLELCRRVSSLLGKEAAVLLPSGTMCNEIALAVHCRPGDEVICDSTAHLIHFEGGAPAALSGVMIHTIQGERGIYSQSQLATALERPQSRYAPRTRLVWVEQTANLAGGTIWPLETIQSVVATAHEAGLVAHMDGARLMNAVVATGIDAKEYAKGFDSVWIDFTKGLGAPMGSVLAGSKEFIDEAWRLKQRWGGAFRQAGFLAAAHLYALDNHVDRLLDDHRHARLLSEGLSKLPLISITPTDFPTNIIFFDVAKTGLTAKEVVAAAKLSGLGLGAFGPTSIRAVTCINISAADVTRAVQILQKVLVSKVNPQLRQM